MKSFVDIKTFFDSNDNRTVSDLSQIYNDREKLQTSVKELLFRHLSPADFRDKRVLLKPNFVKENHHTYDEICLFTHPSLIIATITVLLDCSPKSIIVGDAPIQDCHWDKLLPPSFVLEIENLSKEFGIPISICDFRKVVFDSTTNVFGQSKRTAKDYIIFDVAQKSYLEPITGKRNKFRVTNYNPDRMKLFHSKGMHRYCVAKEIFESDIVITMPKTKTHRMACLTNSLKILVGIVGDKEYLPHHRIGPKSFGGDCYKSFSFIRSCSEYLLDFANRRRGTSYYNILKRISYNLWNFSKPNNEITINAGWHGNDTVWRMVMDLNQIALYGKIDGTLSNIPQRVIYTLCDGIVGGQGSGPLQPEPLALGILSFSNDAYLMDEIMGYIFSLDIDKVPLLKAAMKQNINKEKEFIINGLIVGCESVKALKTDVRLAPGWVNYNKS